MRFVLKRPFIVQFYVFLLKSKSHWKYAK